MPPVKPIPGDPNPEVTALRYQEVHELGTTILPRDTQELLSLGRPYYHALISLLALQGTFRLGVSQSELLCLLHVVRLQHEYNSAYVSTYALSIALNRSLRHVDRYIKRFCDLSLLIVTSKDFFGAHYDLAPAFALLIRKQWELDGQGVSDAE